jgi:hypothetical protein
MVTKTEEYIQLIVDNDKDKLYKFYDNPFWSVSIDFGILFEKINNLSELNPSAQNVLGLIYYYGFGVEKNYEKAAQYFKLSSDGGDRYAQSNLSIVYKNGNYVKSIYYGWMSHKNGYKNALRMLINDSLSEYRISNINDLILKYKELKKRNKELEKRNKELEQENIELKYRPNNIGYQEAEEDFIRLVNIQEKN